MGLKRYIYDLNTKRLNGTLPDSDYVRKLFYQLPKEKNKNQKQDNYNKSKSCGEGMFYNYSTQECEEKKCKCIFGENYAANGINCPNNGDEN